MENPTTNPTETFTAKIFNINESGAFSDMRTGISSSEVERKTAIKVPAVIAPPEKKDAAAAENPHWGMAPAKEPTRGPKQRVRPSPRSSAPPARDSNISSTR